ncbi:MAG: hypothetical protein IPN34_18615 [Planctomycetes bacterium]|nr:hypothetical protein [Planctomycetota bacterium]
MLRILAALVLLASALAAPSLHAQAPIRIVGRLEAINGPTICNQRLTHRLECTRVYLVSRAVDLSLWTGQVVDLQGVDRGLLCTVIDVTQVQPASGHLAFSGNPTLGSTLTFTLTGPGMSFNAALLGSGPLYMPIDLSLGTLLVAPPIYLLGGGASIGSAQFSVQIPVDPTLSGYEAYVQSIHQTLGPVGPPFLGNAVCFAIR